MKRKIIHISSFLIPLLYYLLPSDIHAKIILSGVAGIYIFFDVLRLKVERLNQKFHRIFGGVIKSDERKHITSGSWLLIASLICVFTFPKEIAILALSYTAIGDTMAFFIGKKFGKRKLLGRKTIEGTAGGFMINILLAFVFPGNHITFVVGAVVASLSETLSLPVDDNFSIPLLSGGIMTLCSGIISFS